MAQKHKSYGLVFVPKCSLLGVGVCVILTKQSENSSLI